MSEDNNLPPLNSHAAAASALAATQAQAELMQQLLSTIQSLSVQVSELTARSSNQPLAGQPSVSETFGSSGVNTAESVDVFKQNESSYDEEEDELSTRSSSIRPVAPMRLSNKPPPIFSIDLQAGQSLVDKLDELDVFLERLDVYFEGIEMTHARELTMNQKINQLMNLVDDEVFKSIKDVKSRLIDNNVKIETIDQLFEDIKALCASDDFDVAAKLDSMKQSSNQTVEHFFMKFTKLHDRAVRQGIATRDASVLWFMNGLRPAIGREVKLAVRAHGLLRGTTSAKQALNKCFNTAKAFEADMATNGRTSWRDRPNQSATNQSTNQSINQSANAPRSKNADNEPSREDKLKHFMSKYKMSAVEVERHWANNLCFVCHNANHAANACPKRAPRLNMTSVNSGDRDDESGNEADSKN